MSASLATSHVDAPETSSIEIVSPEALHSEAVRAAVAYWNALRANRPYPRRDELLPAAMAKFLRHIVLVRVLGGGADYEYRVVGDAHVQAQGYNFRHMRLKEIEALRVDFATRATYEHVRITALPFAVRGWIGRYESRSRFSYHETAFLPLGAGGVVDHLLIVSTYVPRGVRA
ncbi:MAG: PAS domain-containing protein [Rhizomicrobium sp.]|jgi:hypothetical protein